MRKALRRMPNPARRSADAEPGKRANATKRGVIARERHDALPDASDLFPFSVISKKRSALAAALFCMVFGEKAKTVGGTIF